MLILFVILIIVASIVLTFLVLVQNPKGGGLAGNIAGFSNQFMGVKQTTDVLEKGTWIFGTIIAVLCIISSIFISGATGDSELDNINTNVPVTAPPPAQNPANSVPLQQTQPAAGDTNN